MSKPHMGLVAAYKGHTKAGAVKGIVLGYRRQGANPEDGLLVAKGMIAMANAEKCGINQWGFWVDDPEIAPKVNAKTDQITAADALMALEAGINKGYPVTCINTRRGLKVRVGPESQWRSSTKSKAAPTGVDFMQILKTLQAD